MAGRYGDTSLSLIEESQDEVNKVLTGILSLLEERPADLSEVYDRIGRLGLSTMKVQRALDRLMIIHSQNSPRQRAARNREKEKRLAKEK